jgi:PKD repeat protein
MKYKSPKYFTLFFIVIALYLNHGVLYSQKYGEAWIVGKGNDSTDFPKRGKTELNFASCNINIQYKPGKALPSLGFTNASLANEDGTLKCFTDGFRVYDGDQEVIPGGDSINYGDIWRKYEPLGNYPASYNHVFLPQPGHELNNSFLFHLPIELPPSKPNGITPAFKMTKVYVDSVDGKASVPFKDSIILSGEFVRRHLACTKHANGRDWWIIIEDFESDNHRIFLFDPSGIRLYRTEQIGPTANMYDWSGNSQFTSDGKKFIKYLTGYQMRIFDFDRCTGELSNPKTFSNQVGLLSNYNYFVVSSNSRFLYFNSDTSIWQYDLLANDIKKSETLVGEWDGFVLGNSLHTAFHQMSLAEDGKIYVSCKTSNIYIHVIHNPNEKGAACNFQLRGLEIPAYTFGSLPFLPNYKLGPADGTTCDTLGIDNLPVAHFGYYQDTNQYLNVTFRDLSYHEPEEWYWDFGDNGTNPTSREPSPFHIFPKPGIYKVCLTVKNKNGENTICKNLQLGTTETDDTGEHKSSVTVFPNPVKNKFIVNMHDYLPMNARITLTDLSGKIVHQSKLYNGINTLNIAHLPSGVYLYNCIDHTTELGSGKIIRID